MSLVARTVSRLQGEKDLFLLFGKIVMMSQNIIEKIVSLASK